MSAADPRCLVCRGSGVVDAWGRGEACACTEVPRRNLDVAPQPGWVGEALGDALRRAEERRVAAEEHRAACTGPECARCGRYLCVPCGAAADESRKCDACKARERDARAVAAFRETIPRRFRWAFDATAERLVGRVRASGELIARGLANPPAADVLFTGDSGVGKTSLAVAMLDAYVRQAPRDRRGAMFVETYRLAGARARHPLGQGEAPDVRAAMEASLLVVDDLGSEVDDRRNVFADVIFHRHNEEIPTWITTGFSSEQITARYGAAVVRRILEQGKRVQLGAGERMHHRITLP